MIPWMVWSGTTYIGRVLARNIVDATKMAANMWRQHMNITITPIVEDDNEDQHRM